MTVLDTSVVVEMLRAGGRMKHALREALEDGERLALPAIVLYEWLRGPRRPEELVAQEELFPAEMALSFGHAEARVAAELYRSVRRARGREIDLAIAATAITWDAQIWTLNDQDFVGIPDLALRPRR